jgi:hypothetical protein
MGSQCNRCGKPFTLTEKLKDWNRTCCTPCLQHIDQVIRHWAKVLEQKFPQEGITSELEQMILSELTRENIPIPDRVQLTQPLQSLRAISEIRWGNITPIHAQALLETHEHAYFEVRTTYQKYLKSQTQFIPGVLLGTDRKIAFISSIGKDSNTIRLDNIGVVTFSSSTVQIQTTKGRGGTYQVAEPLYIKTYIETLAKRWKMQILIQREQAGSRLIPQDLRVRVLQKYSNRCAWCGASGEDKGVGLEMDHIKPFSQGGPSTFENLQPLCGPCNKKKGSRL